MMLFASSILDKEENSELHGKITQMYINNPECSKYILKENLPPPTIGLKLPKIKASSYNWLIYIQHSM